MWDIGRGLLDIVDAIKVRIIDAGQMHRLSASTNCSNRASRGRSRAPAGRCIKPAWPRFDRRKRTPYSQRIDGKYNFDLGDLRPNKNPEISEVPGKMR
jgi:hypothetical protein